MAHTAKVLVIEDDAALRRSLCAFLEDAGCQTFEADCGSEGLEIFARVRPDVIVTDLRMPGMDGLAVLASIKRQNPRIPVIVVSGTGDMSLLEEAVSLGASAGLRKPIADLGELQAAIERVTGSPLS